MEEDIQTRLEDTSKNCLEAYNVWNEKKQDKKAQGDLHSAIHELRKVSSRLEIELAISEREHITSKPIPIPSHRSNNKGASAPILAQSSMDDGSGGGKPIVQKSAPRRRRTQPPQTK